jgi:uncharacterized lipoprotein YmbA
MMLALLLAACEGGGPGVETLLMPGSAQVNLTVCPAPIVTPVPAKR